MRTEMHSRQIPRANDQQVGNEVPVLEKSDPHGSTADMILRPRPTDGSHRRRNRAGRLRQLVSSVVTMSDCSEDCASTLFPTLEAALCSVSRSPCRPTRRMASTNGRHAMSARTIRSAQKTVAYELSATRARPMMEALRAAFAMRLQACRVDIRASSRPHARSSVPSPHPAIIPVTQVLEKV